MKAQSPELISQNLLKAVRYETPTISYQKELDKIPLEKLAALSDDEKNAFWLNIYNAFVRIIIRENDGIYNNRGKLFSNKFISVAGTTFSLDEIEHDILRHSQWKYGLGYLKKCCSKATLKKLRVNTFDKRIHFALNCAAQSCPPVLVYESEYISKQLELATRNYLEAECTVDYTKEQIELPAIFSWFRGDFGGRKGVIRFLKSYGIVRPFSNPKIKFKKWDWNLAVNNYK